MFEDFVLRVEKCYHTMDMSVSNSGSYAELYCLDELKKDFKIKSVDFSPIVVVGADENSVTLRWNRVDYEVPFNKKVTTEWVQRNNPYLSVDEMCYNFHFSKINLDEKAIEYATRVGEIHEEYGTYNTSLYREKKEMALWCFKRLLDLGWVSYYPLYAIYKTADNWSEGTINRFDEYFSIMDKGIKGGCLSVEDPLGWSYFSIIVYHNEDLAWGGHCRRYTDLVKAAVEAGIEEAVEIWEQYGRGDLLYERPVWTPTEKDYILHIRSCEDTLHFDGDDLGYKYESHYYTLADLKPGMIIQDNKKYPPVEVVKADKTGVELKYNGIEYKVPLNQYNYTKEAYSEDNNYVSLALNYRVKKEDEVIEDDEDEVNEDYDDEEDWDYED